MFGLDNKATMKTYKSPPPSHSTLVPESKTPVTERIGEWTGDKIKKGVRGIVHGILSNDD